MFKLFHLEYGIMFCAILTEQTETALLGYQNDGCMRTVYLLFFSVTF